MELPPPHVLAQLDALIVGQSIAAPSVEVEDDDDVTSRDVLKRLVLGYPNRTVAGSPSHSVTRPNLTKSFEII